jgi:hypothetical protein
LVSRSPHALEKCVLLHSLLQERTSTIGAGTSDATTERVVGRAQLDSQS